MQDIIIIGGGIAGLYCAYKIKKRQPNTNLFVLEKNREGYLGGRTGNEMFEGASIVTGAGIGRKKKDKLLVHLLRELHIKSHEFMTGPSYSPLLGTHCDVKSVFLELKRLYDPAKNRHMTFQKYATSHLGKEKYQYFIICAGYTDYENESAYDVLFYYGFEDNYSQWKGLGINWKALIDMLAKKIGIDSIKYSQGVHKIHKIQDGYLLKTNNQEFSTKKVVIATTVNPLKKMLAGHAIYKQIHSQPFIRLYGKFSKDSIQILKETVPALMIVPGPMHKIIPMNADFGIYMIAYSDNDGARIIHDYGKNTKTNREHLARLFEASVGLPKNTLDLEAIVEYFWEEGTHYNEPMHGSYKNRDDFLQEAQRPEKNIWVVGEMVSKNQGWVEGALESVEAIINEI
jgi:hypothetical protein